MRLEHDDVKSFTVSLQWFNFCANVEFDGNSAAVSSPMHSVHQGSAGYAWSVFSGAHPDHLQHGHGGGQLDVALLMSTESWLTCIHLLVGS